LTGENPARRLIRAIVEGAALALAIGLLAIIMSLVAP
jgi:hypothetical protein